MVPLQSPASLSALLNAVFAENGVDPRAWALGFARATPAVTLVPAFGLSAVPTQVRVVLALSLGLCIAPALARELEGSGPLAFELARQAFLGVPVALLGSLSIYVAAMAGGLIDDLRGAREGLTLPSLPEQLPPAATLFALLSSVAFLETGGAARVARALSAPALSSRLSWTGVVQAFAGSVEVAFAIAAPIVVASVLLETGSALIARAASPAFIGPLLAPLKAVALLGVLALILERIAELISVVGGAYLN